jgi:hypothetical protein
MHLHFAAVISTCVVLAGCSGVPTSNPDPLADVDRLADVTLPEGTSPEDAVAAALAIAAAPEQSEGGFLSQLFGGGASDGGTASNTTAAVTRTGPDAQVILYGQSIGYGEIATVCDVPNGSLGTIVADISGYKIYDTIPNATALRPHYITGFDDGCARQFAAALSLVGDVGTHEIVRYLPTNRNVPYSATDSAYEAIKASYCRVSHGTPCGSRIDRLAGNTTFVTAYEKFGAHPRWVEILLHDGEVKAIDFKNRQ